MKLSYLTAAISISMFCSTSNGCNSAIASEPEHLCYFVPRSDKVLDLSSVCPDQKKKSRSSKKHSSTEIGANSSQIQPAKNSHYPPAKFMDNFKQK